MMLMIFIHKEPDADPGLAGMAVCSTTGRSYNTQPPKAISPLRGPGVRGMLPWKM